MDEGAAPGSWSMAWGDETESSDFDLLSLALPTDQTLVAEVRVATPPSAAQSDERVYLCARHEDNLAVRSGEGRLMWLERNGVSVSPSSTRVGLPDPISATALAMVDGYHLIEWASAEDYSIEGNRLSGHGSNVGRFIADLHPDHHFIRSASIGEPGRERILLRTTAHWLVPSSGHGLLDSNVEVVELANFFDR